MIVEALATDRDYKVRAATAEAIGSLGISLDHRHRAVMAVDDNWHVRERLIRGMTADAPVLDAEVCDIVATHPSWARCPAHVRTSMSRLMLLTDATPRSDWHEAHDKALFGLLREIRTNSLVPPEQTTRRLIDIGRTSDHWLVRQEADLLSAIAGDGAGGIRSARESFRRLRDSHAVQIALDVRDLDQALEIAHAAAAAGANLIEVGDPLIKAVALRPSNGSNEQCLRPRL